MKLAGKTALVTGGAVRIGRAVCERLAAEGCAVVVHYRNSARAAAGLVRALRAGGGRAWALASPLASEADCLALVDGARRLAGRLDILVNNAAVFHKDGLRNLTGAGLQAELWTNALAPVHLTRALAARVPARATRCRAKVVNLLDRRVAGNETGCLPYLLSKKMLGEFTRNAAAELAPGVTVNGVAPGAILPPPGRGLNYLRDRAGPVPMRLRCTPADVAEGVVFCLQHDWLTGQVLYVDGGQHLVMP